MPGTPQTLALHTTVFKGHLPRCSRSSVEAKADVDSILSLLRV